MSTRNLSSLFRPKSVAVLGAAERDNTVGSLVMRNLLHGGFTGPIMPVNAKLQSVGGVLAYKTVESLPVVPDMAILCTPPNTIAEDIRKLGERGTRAAIVLTGGLATTLDDKGQPLIVKVM
jgi:acetyltransferase